MQSGRQGIEPSDLSLDERQIRRSVSRLAANDGGDVCRHVLRQERLDVERGDIADGDGEHHPDANFGIGSENDVERLLVLWHQRVHILDGGDAVPQAFHRAE